ncbi:MAG: hypothetical protein ACTSUO_08480 [Candidatus Thorarchaeota archaeon]
MRRIKMSDPVFKKLLGRMIKVDEEEQGGKMKESEMEEAMIKEIQELSGEEFVYLYNTLFDTNLSVDDVEWDLEEGSEDLSKEKAEEGKVPSTTDTETTKIKKLTEEAEVRKIKETDKYEIVMPLTHSAMRSYGEGTKWSIAAETPAYWDLYQERGWKIFVVIDKETGDKYWVGISPEGRIEVYDVEEERIGFLDYLTRKYGITKEDLEVSEGEPTETEEGKVPSTTDTETTKIKKLTEEDDI